MSENQLTDVERYLTDVGRAMMDSAITEKDDARSNDLARVGDALTRLNTIYGPKADDFTPRDWALVEGYIAAVYEVDNPAVRAYTTQTLNEKR